MQNIKLSLIYFFFNLCCFTLKCVARISIPKSERLSFIFGTDISFKFMKGIEEDKSETDQKDYCSVTKISDSVCLHIDKK